MSVITGQVVLVAGAATPVGRSISEAFASAGARLLLTDIVAGHLDEVAESIGARTGRRPECRLLRVTDPEAWAAAVDAAERGFGRLDLVVNAAEFDPGKKWQEATADDWSLAVDINLLGVVHGLAVSLPALRRSAGGFIAVSAESAAGGGHVLRIVSRTVALAFSRGVRDELAPAVTVATAVVRAGAERIAGTELLSALRRGATRITVDAAASNTVL